MGAAAAVVIIALVGAVIFLVSRPQEQAVKEEEGKRSVVVSQDNVEEVIQQMEEQEFVEPGYYTVSMNNEWHFATGDAVSENAFVENVVNNTNDVYFDIVMEDNEDEVIYRSPVLQRGAKLQDIALDKTLDEGSYNCVCIYHLVDENQETVSTLRVTLTVTVGA